MSKGRKTLRPGSWKVVCDKTGFRVWAEETAEEWNGLRVLHSVYDERHPQDFAYVPNENPSLPFARPQTTEVFLGTNDVLYSYFPELSPPVSPPPPPPPPASGAIQPGLLLIALSNG